MNNDGGPAFPTPSGSSRFGMTLRDYFAGQALAAEMLNSNIESARFKLLVTMADIECVTVHRIMARECYAMADAMLAARQAQPVAEAAKEQQ